MNKVGGGGVLVLKIQKRGSLEPMEPPPLDPPLIIDSKCNNQNLYSLNVLFYN